MLITSADFGLLRKIVFYLYTNNFSMLIIGNKSFGPEDFELKRLDHNQAPR